MTFAGTLFMGMSFCEGHAELIAKAMEDSAVEIVDVGIQSRMKEA